MSIPKIIHQVWEGRTEPKMPTRLKILARTWQEQNPTWEYHLWNGEEMDKLVETHFPEYLSMYKSFPYNVQRWDTIRYMILYVYGGVYTDLDTECFKPIDELLEGKTLCFGEEPPEHYPNGEHLIGNALMVSTVKNEGWKYILAEIQKAKAVYSEQIVMNTTGPFMISRIFPFLEKKCGAQILSYRDTAPVSKGDMWHYIFKKEYSRYSEKIKDAVCAHYFFGSWEKSCSFYD